MMETAVAAKNRPKTSCLLRQDSDCTGCAACEMRRIAPTRGLRCDTNMFVQLQHHRAISTSTVEGQSRAASGQRRSEASFAEGAATNHGLAQV
jgi:coenzyme F420-reducing hydrogenase gamma subunit